MRYNNNSFQKGWMILSLALVSSSVFGQVESIALGELPHEVI